MNDNDRLNAMTELSNVSLKKPTYDSWFTMAHQKQHVFNLAAKMYVEYEMEAEEAITRAQTFIDTFYKRTMKG